MDVFSFSIGATGSIMTAASVIGVGDGVGGDGFGVIFFTFFILTLLTFGFRIRFGLGDDVAAGFVVGSLSKLK